MGNLKLRNVMAKAGRGWDRVYDIDADPSLNRRGADIRIFVERRSRIKYRSQYVRKIFNPDEDYSTWGQMTIHEMEDGAVLVEGKASFYGETRKFGDYKPDRGRIYPDDISVFSDHFRCIWSASGFLSYLNTLMDAIVTYRRLVVDRYQLAAQWIEKYFPALVGELVICERTSFINSHRLFWKDGLEELSVGFRILCNGYHIDIITAGDWVHVAGAGIDYSNMGDELGKENVEYFTRVMTMVGRLESL